MLPKLIEWPVPIHCYGLLIAMAFLICVPLMKRDAKKAGIDPNVINDMAFWGLLLGILGTRILYICQFPESFSWTKPWQWFAIWKGGLTFQGGPPVVAVFCYFYLTKKGQPTWSTADVIFPYLALGHAFGRTGCFLNGCCYGLATNKPWGVSFPPDSYAARQVGHLSNDVAAWSVHVHPTQLYSITALVSLCLFLLFLRKKWNPFGGFTMPVYFILYSLYRFFVEFIRGDDNPKGWGDLSQQQVICLGTIAIGVVMFAIMWFFLRGKPKAEATAPNS